MKIKEISSQSAVADTNRYCASSGEYCLRALICGALTFWLWVVVPSVNASPSDAITDPVASAQSGPGNALGATRARGGGPPTTPALEKKSATSLQGRYPRKGPPPERPAGLISPGKERPER